MSGEMNDIEEIKALRFWEHGLLDDGRTLQETAKLAVRGIDYCPEDEDCNSRNLCGEHCYCVRQACPSPEHYELHLKLRTFYEKNMAKRIFAKAVKDGWRNKK